MSVNTVPETQMELKRAALINIGCTCLGKSWQTAMAERLGVSQRTLRYWVSGEYEVPDKFLYKAFEVGKQRISEIETCLSQQQEFIDNMVLDSFQTIYVCSTKMGTSSFFIKPMVNESLSSLMPLTCIPLEANYPQNISMIGG